MQKGEKEKKGAMFSFWEGGRAGSILGIMDEHIDNSLEALWGWEQVPFSEKSISIDTKSKKKREE
jgi:hypothetical protein